MVNFDELSLNPLRFFCQSHVTFDPKMIIISITFLMFQNDTEAILKIKESMLEDAKRFEKETDPGGGGPPSGGGPPPGGGPSTPGSSGGGGGGPIGSNGGGPGEYYMQ